MGPLGIFGGTFDPIHCGHLRAALELLEALQLAEVRFVLASVPPHRAAPRTPAAVRLKLLEAALAQEPRFVADARELRRSGPSYTVDTLESLREENPDRPICLLLGMDAFLALPSWYRWQRLFELAHVIVAHRPGWRLDGGPQLAPVLATRCTDRISALHEQSAGCVHVLPITQLEISASALRGLVAAGRDPRYLVPDVVREMIIELDCYTDTEAPPEPASSGT